jgi:hydrogenase nickel incorporation protein HypA/HybF
MHELAITQAMIATLTEKAESLSPGIKVIRVSLEIGRLSGILPDAIRFSFEVCTEGTLLGGARLEIEETIGMALCSSCKEILRTEVPIGVCRCGSSDLEWLAGTEMKIKEMEII